ncbi:MAG: hypothetical protein Q7J69_05575 [Candidatus Omnitrophota bacterium]|nr:hypothetical protein [Candidatus Omnitrophota bacterium]
MEPYLSFVVAARNDNYGGDFLQRIQLYVDVLFRWCGKYQLDSELVVVEWNPPSERPPLREAVRWPGAGWPRVRIVQVPQEMHRSYPNSDKMPMFEYIAKNVGLRRARGRFCLSMNPDTLVSESLVRFFSKKRFSEGSYYRVDRYDVDPSLLRVPPEQLEPVCRSSWFRVHRRDGSFSRSEDRLRPLRKLLRPLLHPRGMLSDVRQSFARAGKPSARMAKAHGNASGDFFLMSAGQWEALCGFPELTTHSHIDSTLCLLAAAKLRQVILPYPLYHQEHSRAEHAQRPLTDLQSIQQNVRVVLEKGGGRSLDLDGTSGNWGLPAARLEEWVVPAREGTSCR